MRRTLPKKPKPSPSPSVPDFDSAGEAAEAAQFDAATAYIPDAIDDTPHDAAATDEPMGEGIPKALVATALAPTFRAAFHFAATIRGSHWELQDFEKEALVEGWTPIVQYLLAKLGSQEQVMVTVAIMTTTAVVGGKLAQDLTKPALSKVSTKTQTSGGSYASSASATAARQPEQRNSFEEQSE